MLCFEHAGAAAAFCSWTCWRAVRCTGAALRTTSSFVCVLFLVCLCSILQRSATPYTSHCAALCGEGRNTNRDGDALRRSVTMATLGSA